MLVVLPTSILLVLLSVVFHYNTLSRLAQFLVHRDYHHRGWVAVSVLGMLLAHVVEIEMFAVGYMFLEDSGEYGELLGTTSDDAAEYSYFSFVAYTSLGFGDITPTGALRLLTGLETLTGLILIAWSASFIFMQMRRFWEGEGRAG